MGKPIKKKKKEFKTVELYKEFNKKLFFYCIYIKIVSLKAHAFNIF